MHLIKLFTSTSTHVLKHQKSPLFHYTQFKSGPRPTRQYRQYRQEDRQPKLSHSPIRKLDPSYWQSIIPKIQPPAARVVNLLLNPNSSRKQISRQLQQYLEFRNTTFSQNMRTDLGCISVLIALNHTRNSQNIDEYENRIVDFITLSDINNNQYDSTMLRHIILAINKRMSMNVQKNIRQYYRLKLVEICLDNFERIDDKDISVLISVFQQSIDKDKNNFITKWRFYPLFQAVQSRIIKLMSTHIDTNSFQLKRQIDAILSPQLYFKFINLIYFYGFLLPEDALIVAQFITKRDSQMYSEHNVVMSIFNTLCYIPYVEILDKDNKTTTIRKHILAYIQSKYVESSHYRKYWNDFSIPARKYTIQKFFQDQFHSTFKSLPFETFQDKYLLLKKQHLSRPQIPQFLWRLFKQHEKLNLEKFILNDCIMRLYPQKVSITKEQLSDYSQRRISFSDNQANLKIWQALNNLGYEYKKQQICADRQVDLVIDENIILQVDGEGHYMYLSNELAPETTFRNLHLLLSGYKLVIISMFEYNTNRNVQQLQKLIKEKVQLVKLKGYVYVC